MSREAYPLPAGAPCRLVWFHLCDVCRRVGAGPARSDLDLPLDALIRKGWRCLTTSQHSARIAEGLRAPWDTCPKCLAKETDR